MKHLKKLWFFMALAMMLSLTAFAASEVEDNGGITTATAISVNTSVTGNLSDSWDYDYYKFTITENQMIQLSLSTTGSKPHHNIQLLDASGNEYFETNLYSTDDANPYYSNRYNLPAGTYYVRIKPYSTSSSSYNGGTYTLQVLQESASSAGIRETEDNDGISTADSLQVNTNYVGNLEDSWDYDYYKFTLTQSGNVEINLTTAGSKPHYKISLSDSSSSEYFSKNLYSTSDPNPYTSNSYNLPAGTYYILVKPYSTSSSSYNGNDYILSVSVDGTTITTTPDTTTDTTTSIVTPTVPDTTTPSTSEIEDNGGITTATAISVNTSVTGNLSDSWDYDYYKFTITENQMIQLSLSTTGSKPHHKIQLLDASGNEYFETNLYSTDDANPYYSNRYNLPAGTYYVRIKPYSTSSSSYNGGTYTLQVLQEAATTAGIRETEDNDGISTADSLQVNTNYVGNLEDSWDYDYYKFTISENQMIQLSLTTAGSKPHYNIQLLDANGDDYFETNLYSTDDANPYYSNRYNLPAGTYYVMIKPYSTSSSNYNGNDYILKAIQESASSVGIRETEENDGISTADSILVNTNYVGNLEDSWDYDYYKFTLTQSSNVQINLTTAGTKPHYKISLSDSSSSEYFSESLDSTSDPNPYASDTYNLPAGTYYILVKPYSTSSSNYNGNDYTLSVSLNSATVSTTTFTDVPTGIWYEANVNAMAAAGIINGIGDNMFAPDNLITYAETAKLAAMVHAQLTNSNYDFTVYGTWYDVYFDYLDAHNFPTLYGVSATQNLTRLQFAEVMSGILNTFTHTEMARNTVNDNGIPDVSSTYDYVYSLYRAGILTGSDSAGTFNPSSSISRAEVAAIVHRFIDTDQRQSITLY